MLPFQKRFFFSLLLCIPILCCGQVLFPGDTNNDGLCNYLDLLPVGLCYGLEGPPRPIPGTAWLPSNYILWPQNMPGTVLNHAFADADGNGFVDSLDLTAILLNYGLSQNQSVPEPMSYFPIDSFPNGMAIQVVYDKDTVMAGDTYMQKSGLTIHPHCRRTPVWLVLHLACNTIQPLWKTRY